MAPYIFIHDTGIVNRGLKLLFFGHFFRYPPSARGLIVLFFGVFAIFRSFYLNPPGNFSAEALGCEYHLFKSFGLGLIRSGNRTQVYRLLA